MLLTFVDQRARTPSEHTRRLRGGGAAAKAGAATTLAGRAVTTTALAAAAERGALATEGGGILAATALAAAVAVAATVAAASAAEAAALARGARGAVAAPAEASTVLAAAQPGRRGAALLLLVGGGHAVVREAEEFTEVGDALVRQEIVVVLPGETVAHKLARCERFHQLQDGEVAHVFDLGVFLELLVIFGNHDTICTRGKAHTARVSEAAPHAQTMPAHAPDAPDAPVPHSSPVLPEKV